MEKLLTTNAKLAKNKGKASRYLISGLSLAPAKLSGHDVCAWKTRGCAAACVLHFAGRRVMPVVRERAKRITQWLFADRDGFEKQLKQDISAHEKRCKKLDLKCAVRLNVASVFDWSHIVKQFPRVIFYDYTKSSGRMLDYISGRLPSNYHLTFSDSERADFRFLRSVLESGHNVACVFDVHYNAQRKEFGALPKTVCVDGLYVRVIDGDRHDVRLPGVDGRGVIVGWRLKGTNAAKSRGRASGFAKPEAKS